ncbi:MAG: ABC transporter permease [Deltaproteobacteria bacterium]
MSEATSAPPLAARVSSPVRATGWLAQELAVIGVLWRRDLMRFLRQPSRLVGALGQPIIFWGVIGTGMAGTFKMPGSPVGYLEYFFPGVILMVVVFASIFATVSVIEDRHAGFLLPVLVAPGSRGALVLGRCLGATSVSLIQAGLFLLLAPYAGFPFSHIDWPLLLGALTLVSLGLTAFGFAIAWALDNLQAFHAIQMTLLLPLWIVSGAMFPASERYPAFQTVLRYNPLSYAVSASRAALYGGALPAGLAATAPAGATASLAVLAAFTALCLGAAVAVCVKRR